MRVRGEDEGEGFPFAHPSPTTNPNLTATSPTHSLTHTLTHHDHNNKVIQGVEASVLSPQRNGIPQPVELAVGHQAHWKRGVNSVPEIERQDGGEDGGCGLESVV